MPRPLTSLLAGFSLFAASITAWGAEPGRARLTEARALADAAFATILGALAPANPSARSLADLERSSLGINLADYAQNPGAASEQFESLAEASRRILAGGATPKRAPDITSAWLDDTANRLLTNLDAIASAAGARPSDALATELVTLRARALLARYHARRTLAAVHYNLFKRGLRLAELVAATYGEREAILVWRELVASCPTHPLAPQWRAELKKLEWSLKELEDQCCPPDESILKEKIWEPAAGLAAELR